MITEHTLKRLLNFKKNINNMIPQEFILQTEHNVYVDIQYVTMLHEEIEAMKKKLENALALKGTKAH